MARETAIVDAEYTKQENRKGYLQDEISKLERTKEALEAEIAKKSNDYNVYMAQRDSDLKKLRQETLDVQTKLEIERAEFGAILQNFQKDKALFLEQKQTTDNKNAQYEAKMNNIRQFVTAVQRACSLLGL